MEPIICTGDRICNSSTYGLLNYMSVTVRASSSSSTSYSDAFRSRNKVFGRAKSRPIRVSNLAATADVNGRRIETRTTTASNSALEQLDFERGVCVPFRKYSPETVSVIIISLFYLMITNSERNSSFQWAVNFRSISLHFVSILVMNCIVHIYLYLNCKFKVQLVMNFVFA